MLREGLRKLPLWLALGLIIIVVVAALSLMPVSELPAVGVSDKIEHALAYALLALWFGGLFRVSHFLWVGLALSLLGAAIEFAQGAMGWGRQADWRDLLANTAGIVIGLMAAATRLGRWASRVERRLLDRREA
ncbi:MAG: hypothetical protein RL026_386 [Pseudomonadota bacterium]